MVESGQAWRHGLLPAPLFLKPIINPMALDSKDPCPKTPVGIAANASTEPHIWNYMTESDEGSTLWLKPIALDEGRPGDLGRVSDGRDLGSNHLTETLWSISRLSMDTRVAANYKSTASLLTLNGLGLGPSGSQRASFKATCHNTTHGTSGKQR